MSPPAQDDVWAGGHYDELAPLLRPASTALTALVERRAGHGGGRRALDLAAGTGSLAIALAHAGWSVEALDSSPAMLAHGRAASTREAVDVTWREATFEALPVEDMSLDLLASSFGLIFASDPALALSEVHRVLRPAGTLALTAWASDGHMAQNSKLMSGFLAPWDSPSPFLWGDPGTVRGWLGSTFADLETIPLSLPWHFDSAAEATRFIFTNSPGHVLAMRHAGERGAAMRDAVQTSYHDLSEPDGTIRLDLDYLAVLARRA